MNRAHTTPASILGMKGGAEKIAALTVYDFAMAQMLDAAGIPLLLVGDSLGMVVLGYPDTTFVTMGEMEHHVRAVARAKTHGLVVADMPFGSYPDAQTALLNARRLMAAGAHAVKAEGGTIIAAQIRGILADGIPFLGHLGMLPQNVRVEGGYHIKGKIETEHQALMEDAAALAEWGAFAVVLELITPLVAREITASCSIPTIGIGSGPDCDGQILVVTDLLGTTPGFIPRHVKMRLNLGSEIEQAALAWKESLQRPPANPSVAPDHSGSSRSA